MRARHVSLCLLTLTPLIISCAAPEAPEASVEQKALEQALAKRAEIAASGRYLAPVHASAAPALADNGESLVAALHIPASLNPTAVSLVTPDPEAAFVAPNYGIIRPRNSTFVILSTGRSQNQTIAAEPGTDFPPLDIDGDIVTMTFQVTLPPGLNRMSFDYTFLSAESPDFVGTRFNDTFTATVSDTLGPNRQIATTSVTSAVFHPASAATVGPCPFQLLADNAAEVDFVFNQEGFSQEDAGTTGVQHVNVPVSGGTVTVTFDIRDLGDGILDSAVILDNLRFSRTETVDPQPDIMDRPRAQVIRTTTLDPRLITDGAAVVGAAADGVSEILLRSNVPGPGTAVFSVVSGQASDGNLSNDDGPPVWGLTATTSAVEIQSKWYVFALYRSPPDYNRGEPTTDATDPRRFASVSMVYTSSLNEQIEETIPLDIVRPPVVIVPEIWGTCQSWEDANGLASPDTTDPSLKNFAISCAHYEETSSKSFTNEDNEVVVAEAIIQALTNQRDTGVAVTRADVIGHGMGGLLARRFIDGDDFAGFDNFRQGAINRLILLHTPQLGSRLADEFIRTRNTLRDDDATNGSTNWEDAKEELTAANIHFDDADQDLALQEMGAASAIIDGIGTNSPAHTQLVHYHALIGSNGHSIKRNDIITAGLLPSAIKNFMLVMEQNHPSSKPLPLPPASPNRLWLMYGPVDPQNSIIFCNDPATIADEQHDLVATIPEQKGGLADEFTTSSMVAKARTRSGHYKVQNDAEHTSLLVGLLNESVTGGKFTTSLPSPGVTPRVNHCPISPPLLTARPARTVTPEVLAQRTITITSPVQGALVAAGGTVNVTVDTNGGEQPTSVLIMSLEDSTIVEQAPFTADVPIPANALGTTRVRALAFYAGGGMAFSAPVILNVQVNATLTSLEVLNGNQVLPRVGRTRQVSVIGKYSDGVRRDLTKAATGTKYTISQLSDIAIVSADGLITAVGAGNATLAVTNGPATATVNVRVLNAPPAAVCSNPNVCNDPGLCSANLPALGAGSTDPDGDPLSFTQVPPGPYSVGTQQVSVAVSDGSLESQCVSQVQVRDCEPPSLTCPANFTAECTQHGGATVVPPAASATDNCAVAVTPPATAVRPLGSTVLTYSASDPSANTSSCTSTVTVQDTQPPSIACPKPVVAECEANGKAYVTPLPAAATDVCTDVTVTGPTPGLFPLGNTLVTYTASDQTGHQATCTSAIKVVDTSKPHVDVLRTPVLSPANHQYRTVHLSDCNIVVKDACGGTLPPSVYQPAITCVTSNEPDDAPGNGDGSTTNDIVIVDATTVRLRAERDDRRNGRVYKIKFSVHDASGNSAMAVCSVDVPRNCSALADSDLESHPECGCTDDAIGQSVCR